MRDPNRLSPLDTSFLHIESERGPMHVGAMCRFDGARLRDASGALDRERILRYVEARVSRAPRFRQRLAPVPFDGGRPIWTDDPHFNIRYHVRFTGLPRPGGLAELERLTAERMAQRLDRDRPLWEMHWVDGLEHDAVGLVLKVHHCMVDGVAGMDVAMVIFDVDPGAADGEVPAWKPRPAPHPLRRWVDAVVERVSEPREWAHVANGALRSPRAFMRGVASEIAGLHAWLGEGLAPRTCLNVPIGPHRRFAAVSLPLEDAKRVKSSLGGTINDVVLATVTGALRRLLLARGAACAGIELHVAVPVNVRRADRGGELGNQVSAMMVRLPIELADPVARHARVRESARAHKTSHEIEAAEVLTQLPGFPPTTFLQRLTDFQAAQRFLNTVVTNVPGPQFPLYACGARLRDLYPCIPLGPNLPLMIGVVSYDGALCFGLMGDWDALADLAALAHHFDEAFDELRRAAATLSASNTPAEPAALPRPALRRDRGHRVSALGRRGAGGKAAAPVAGAPRARARRASVVSTRGSR